MDYEKRMSFMNAREKGNCSTPAASLEEEQGDEAYLRLGNCTSLEDDYGEESSP